MGAGPEQRQFTLRELREGVELPLGRQIVVTLLPGDTPSVLGTLDAAHFEKAKSFPLPPAIPTFRAAASRIAAEPSRALLIVGHTDTQGTDDPNLVLSRERAGAISAYLRNAVGEWMPFYSNPDPQKLWGVREDQHMLLALGFYDGNVDGNPGPRTQDALRRFQAEKGLPATGEADGARTRPALVLAYMQAEGTTVPAGTAIRALGCGVRHLEEKTGPGVDSETNRRVDLFAFESAKIIPAPEECEGGAHPGCTAYDRWKKAVTGKLDAAPAETKIASFGFKREKETAKEGITAPLKPSDVDFPSGTFDAEEGEALILVWNIAGPFKSTTLNGKAVTTKPTGDGVEGVSLKAVPGGEHTESFTLDVTDPAGKHVIKTATVRVHRTRWLVAELGKTADDEVPVYGIDISQNRFLSGSVSDPKALNNPTLLLTKDKVRGQKIEFIIVEATIGTGELVVGTIEFFKDNWTALEKRTDVIRGAYHFFNNAPPLAQAKAFVDAINKRSTKGLSGTLRPFLDLELPVKPANPAQAQKILDDAKKKGITLEFAGPDYLKNAKLWIDQVSKAPPDGLGVKPIVYTVPGPWNGYPAADRSVIAGLKLPLWIAVPGFEDNPPVEPKKHKTFGVADFPGADFADWDLWQFVGSDTIRESFAGLGDHKRVDLNAVNGGIKKLKSLLVP